MTTSDPTGIHDWHSASYVQDWIANQREGDRMDTTVRRMVNLIPFDPDGEVRVLDVGGGYGAVTRAVLETFPRARVTLQDFSEPMIDEARRRLANYSDSVAYVLSDLMDPNWTADIEGQFDAVVSSRAIHNVRFPDRIRAIYADIFRLVAPGGCFLNLDEVVPSGSLVARAERHAQLMTRRQRVFDETGKWLPLTSEEVQGGARRRQQAHGEPTQEDLARISAHAPNALANQLGWLVADGFNEAECFWRDGNRAILGAFRA
jgi:ubiquinone/menaquinone biosynthesis C-methylase UbiE